jgi:hypothetical protein
MAWYAVSAVVYFKLKDAPDQDEFVVWENVYLVDAANGVEARARGEALGRADAANPGDLRQDGRPAEMIFARRPSIGDHLRHCRRWLPGLLHSSSFRCSTIAASLASTASICSRDRGRPLAEPSRHRSAPRTPPRSRALARPSGSASSGPSGASRRSARRAAAMAGKRVTSDSYFDAA